MFCTALLQKSGITQCLIPNAQQHEQSFYHGHSTFFRTAGFGFGMRDSLAVKNKLDSIGAWGIKD
ncbi:MAG: hypothetical protein ACKOC0_05195 [Cytophagales bacterium]